MHFGFCSMEAIPFGVEDTKCNEKLAVARGLEGAGRKTAL